MKTILYGALALGAFGSLATANTEAKSTWLGLDEELHALSSNLTTQTGGPTFGAVIKTVYTHSEDEVFGATPTEDISGFELYNARLWAEGQAGDFGWRLSFDFGEEVENDTPTDGPDLLDAYATWNIAEQFQLTWGQFQFPTLMSNSDTPEELLFINRSALGQALYTWDLGVMVGGDYEQIRWNFALQNGADEASEEYRLSGRVEFDLGGGRMQGGSKGARSQELDATIGVFGFTDDNGAVANADVTAFGADARLTMGAFGVGAELVSVDDGELGLDGAGVVGTPGAFDDATPWSLYASYMLVPDEWEIGVRYEDLDDDAETTILTAGVNWHQPGSPAMWQLNYIIADSDLDAADGDAIQLGLVIGLNS